MKRSLEEVNASFGDQGAMGVVGDSVRRKRYLHVEERRLGKIEELRELRRRIVVEEENGSWKPRRSGTEGYLGDSKGNTSTNSTMI